MACIVSRTVVASVLYPNSRDHTTAFIPYRVKSTSQGSAQQNLFDFVSLCGELRYRHRSYFCPFGFCCRIGTPTLAIRPENLLLGGEVAMSP